MRSRLFSTAKALSTKPDQPGPEVGSTEGPAGPGSRPTALSVTLVAASVVVLLTTGLIALNGAAADSAVPAQPAAATQVDRTSQSGRIALAQERLRRLPGDYQTWAGLGAAYVEEARVTADSSYYPKAASALERSLALRPDDNVLAFVGSGSLANARHEFSQAVDWGQRAVAVDPYNSSAYGVLTDALTELGRYQEAEQALQKMLDLRPGVPSLTRASYLFEQKGDVAAAEATMQQALAQASDPVEVGFCRYHLGELAFNNGDPTAALEQYRLGLAVQPTSDPLLAGAAKAQAALGRDDEAARDYLTVVNRTPLPEYLKAYGELLDSLGRTEEAQAQYAVLGSVQDLFEANGVVDDLTSAVYEADHGSAEAAVRHAEAEWKRNENVIVADALAWALHRAGRSAEALPYAQQANRLGWRNATFAYHLGMIELALDRPDEARRHLSRAIEINPHFSLSQAPEAVAALTTLGGSQ